MAKKYKIGYTDGVFDLFHTGHLNMIETAKSQCDYLIVGVHGDDVVEGYKHRRPIIDEEGHRRILAANGDRSQRRRFKFRRFLYDSL